MAGGMHYVSVTVSRFGSIGIRIARVEHLAGIFWCGEECAQGELFASEGFRLAFLPASFGGIQQQGKEPADRRRPPPRGGHPASPCPRPSVQFQSMLFRSNKLLSTEGREIPTTLRVWVTGGRKPRQVSCRLLAAVADCAEDCQHAAPQCPRLLI